MAIWGNRDKESADETSAEVTPAAATPAGTPSATVSAAGTRPGCGAARNRPASARLAGPAARCIPMDSASSAAAAIPSSQKWLAVTTTPKVVSAG